MKAVIAILLAAACFPFVSPAANTALEPIVFTIRLGNQNFNKTNATGIFKIYSGSPKFEAVLVRYSPNGGFLNNDKNLYHSAKWMPYDGVVHLNLGPDDGVYSVEVALKGDGPDAQATWMGTLVKLRQKKPVVVITCPTNEFVTEPYLQLKGFSPLPLADIRYTISNAVSVLTNQQGSITQSIIDTNTLQYTTDFFQCYDIRLAEGNNAIVLSVKDPAGNMFTTNLSVKLDYARAGKPVIKITWPKEGSEVCGHSFTLRGQVEDSAAEATATITDTNGQSSQVSGIVERTGVLWVQNLPLHDGTNRVVLCVTNSAGLGNSVTLNVVRSLFVLTMDPVKGDLWLPTITATGYESDGTYPVWLNGVKAAVRINSDGSGSWVAQKVPVTEGGVASFDMHAYAPNEIQPDGLCGNGKPSLSNNNATSSSPSQILISKDTSTPATKPFVGISVQPIWINVAESKAVLNFTWNAISNQTYQLQYATDLVSSNWNDLGQPIKATNNTISTSDTIERGSHRFYRVFLLP